MRIQNSKQPFAIRILKWFAGLASAAMCVSILLVLLKIGPVVMGGERVTRTEWLYIAAPLVAAIGILMSMICYALASSKLWSRHLVIVMFTLIIEYALILGTIYLFLNTIMLSGIVY